MKLTAEEKVFVAECKEHFYQYNDCLRKFRNGEKLIVKVIQTPMHYDYNGYRKGTARCYVWTEDGGWYMWFYNLTPHRAKQAVKALQNGTIKNVDTLIVNNYITNGYNTRKGLFAKYSKEQTERMEQIAQSHADYMGMETGDSTTDHWNRVAMRAV